MVAVLAVWVVAMGSDRGMAVVDNAIEAADGGRAVAARQVEESGTSWEKRYVASIAAGASLYIVCDLKATVAAILCCRPFPASSTRTCFGSNTTVRVMA